MTDFLSPIIDLSNYGDYVYNPPVTDGSSDVTASLTSFIENNNGIAVLPPGDYWLRNLDPSVFKALVAAIPGTVNILCDADARAILYTPTSIGGNTLTISAISTQTINNDDRASRITTSTAPSAYSVGDWVHVHSNDSHPSAADRWFGEAVKVLNVDLVNNYVYTTPLVYQASYVTNPRLNRYTPGNDLLIHGLHFRARIESGSGSPADPLVYTRLAAIDITGVVHCRVLECTADNLYSMFVQLRGCPNSDVDVESRRLRNQAVFDEGGTIYTITGITQANPAVVTCSAAPSTISNGDVICLRNVVGMTQVNGVLYRAQGRSGSTFQLQDINGNNVNSTGFGAYVSGGQAVEADVRGFGYGIQFYGPCSGSRGRAKTEGGRHSVTTDGRGSTYNASLWYLWGAPTNLQCEVNGVNAVGVPCDTHEEGANISYKNTTVFYPMRGSTGGTYSGFGAQIRSRNVTFEGYNQVGGHGGIRVSAVQHETVPVHILNDVTIRDTANNNDSDYALLVQSQAAITNKPIVYADNHTYLRVNRPVQLGSNADVRYGNLKIIGPNIRAIEFQGNTSTLSIEDYTVDYRLTTTGSNCYPIYAGGDGANSCYIKELNLILGDAATKPTVLVDYAASSGTFSLKIGKINISNPSGVTIPPMCNSGDYPSIAFDTTGMDVIEFQVAAPTTAVTTSLKAGYTIRRPFIPVAYYAAVNTVSSSGNPTFDINKNGTSIFGTNKLSIDANETNTTTAATPPSIQTSSLTAFVANDVLTVDVDVQGTGTLGAQVYIYGYYV